MSPAIGYLFAIITLIYFAAQLMIVVAAIFFWKRYPRPSLYLSIMASLEVLGSMVQYGLQLFLNWGAFPNGIYLQLLASFVGLAIHLAAMCFLVLAVYVARTPGRSTATGVAPYPGTPGMENSDQAFILDPQNPYSPPRQPR